MPQCCDVALCFLDIGHQGPLLCGLRTELELCIHEIGAAYATLVRLLAYRCAAPEGIELCRGNQGDGLLQTEAEDRVCAQGF